MEFTAVPVDVREREGRLEILFGGKPAYFWTTDLSLRALADEGRELTVRWNPATGEIRELS